MAQSQDPRSHASSSNERSLSGKSVTSHRKPRPTILHHDFVALSSFNLPKNDGHLRLETLIREQKDECNPELISSLDVEKCKHNATRQVGICGRDGSNLDGFKCERPNQGSRIKQNMAATRDPFMENSEILQTSIDGEGCFQRSDTSSHNVASLKRSKHTLLMSRKVENNASDTREVFVMPGSVDDNARSHFVMPRKPDKNVSNGKGSGKENDNVLNAKSEFFTSVKVNDNISDVRRSFVMPKELIDNVSNVREGFMMPGKVDDNVSDVSRGFMMSEKVDINVSNARGRFVMSKEVEDYVSNARNSFAMSRKLEDDEDNVSNRRSGFIMPKKLEDDVLNAKSGLVMSRTLEDNVLTAKIGENVDDDVSNVKDSFIMSERVENNVSNFRSSFMMSERMEDEVSSSRNGLLKARKLDGDFSNSKNSSLISGKVGDDASNAKSDFVISAKVGNDVSSSKRWNEDLHLSGFQKKSRVWCPMSEKKWILGITDFFTDVEAYVNIVDKQYIKKYGQQLNFPISKLLPANPDILEGVIDLTQLSYLNEPSVLYNLGSRYSQDKIYTRAGPVLIAINPFKKLPLYTKDSLASYGTKTEDNHEPHVYSTMASAFKAMMQAGGVNQSVIISGESGAGKTETAKIAMQYLTAVGGSGGLETKLLQTNPILEAFGNAKTSRNDNSSRFGKLIDIFFEDSGKVCGAWIQTYLLEKSRVVLQANGERSYHIFYQLCAGADDTLKDAIHLLPCKDYAYLNESDCLYIENVNDATKFQEVILAMDDVQITKDEQHIIFEMLSAVLWLGNITFSIIDDENHVCVDNNEGISLFNFHYILFSMDIKMWFQRFTAHVYLSTKSEDQR